MDISDSVRIPAGTVLMNEGEKGNCAYLLLHGKMRVERKGKDGPIFLSEITPVNIVGELAILNDTPRTATVITEEECIVLELNRHRLKAIIRRYPDIAEIIIKILCNRLMQSTEKLASATKAAPQPEKQETPKSKIPQTPTADPQRSVTRMATIDRRDRE